MDMRIIALMTLLLNPGVAQEVIARQGIPEPTKDIHFQSPMILVFPIQDLQSLRLGGTAHLPLAENFVLEKFVRVGTSTITKCEFENTPGRSQVVSSKVAKRKQQLFRLRREYFHFKMGFKVGTSYDRHLDLKFTFRKGTKVLAEFHEPDFEASDSEESVFEELIPEISGKLLASSPPDAPYTLELSISLRTDRY